MSVTSVCLPSDALLQHLPSYLDFSYLGRGVSLHGCSSKAQQLLITLDDRYLLTAAVLDLQRGIAPLGPPVPAQSPLLGMLLPAAWPWPRARMAPPSCRPWPWARGGSSGSPRWPRARGGSSQLPPLASGSGWLLRVTAPGLSCEVASPGLP